MTANDGTGRPRGTALPRAGAALTKTTSHWEEAAPCRSLDPIALARRTLHDVQPDRGIELQIDHRVLLDRVTLIAIAGEIDIATAPQLRGYCERHARPDRGRHLALDLTEVAFLDSSGVKVLVDAHLAAGAHGTTVRVAAPSPLVARVFDVLRLGDHIPVHTTVQQALAAVLVMPGRSRAPRRSTLPDGMSAEATRTCTAGTAPKEMRAK
ncbi:MULTISPECIES: anti-sigma factor antagonist [Actinomadura]|uniref:Anti-sigma factor antagonist n=1 Tax=Actinomadura yumaensis TaxID=111807 RepID=A0ABW2CG11_9ACTN|nr:anti-sigma factor antagonist [Actinomadura sp. J1-007]